MSRELERSSPGDLKERLRNALAGKFGPPTPAYSPDGNPVLLLDTTGSMRTGEDYWATHIRAIDRLREAIRPFRGLRRFWYNDDCRELMPGEEIPEPQGNNNEPKAFRLLKTLGIKNLILVTDGAPDSASESLRAAEGLHIDIIYIGPPPPPKFLEDLARKCGGSFDVVKFSTDGAKMLESAIQKRLMIEAPSANTENKGPIIL